jgi:hypothetical protein
MLWSSLIYPAFYVVLSLALNGRLAETASV